MKFMVKFFLPILCGWLFIVPVHAQDASGTSETIKAMKIQHLTKRLKLTDAEKKAFWPLYYAYEEELENLRKKHAAETKSARDDFMTLDDKEIEKMVDAEIAFLQNEVDIRKKYHAQFKKILPVKKVAILYRAEEEFQRMLIRMVNKRTP